MGQGTSGTFSALMFHPPSNRFPILLARRVVLLNKDQGVSCFVKKSVVFKSVFEHSTGSLSITSLVFKVFPSGLNTPHLHTTSERYLGRKGRLDKELRGPEQDTGRDPRAVEWHS